MGFFDKLFKKQEPVPVVQEIDKTQVPVYPMIKSAEWRGIAHAISQPFVTIEGQPHLAIVFAQDAGDRFEYEHPDRQSSQLRTSIIDTGELHVR